MHLEIEERKKEAERRAEEEERKEGTPIPRTPLRRTNSLEMNLTQTKEEKSKKRTKSSPPEGDGEEKKRSKEEENLDEDEDLDAKLEAKEEKYLEVYNRSLEGIERIMAKLKIGKEPIKKVKLALVGYLLRITTLE